MPTDLSLVLDGGGGEDPAADLHQLVRDLDPELVQERVLGKQYKIRKLDKKVNKVSKTFWKLAMPTRPWIFWSRCGAGVAVSRIIVDT